MASQPNPRTLTGEEKESSLSWNETDKDVQVGVYTPRWIRHFEEKLGLKPDEVDENTKDGCRFYTIPKSWLRLPQRPKRLSPSHKAKVVKALQKARSQARQGVKSLSPDRAREAQSPTRGRGKALLRPSRQSPVTRTPRPSK